MRLGRVGNLLLALWCAALCGVVQAAPADAAPFTMVVDPGHNPSQPGALGIKGIYEVAYNDHLAAQVIDALKAEGITVLLTRLPSAEISLDGRAQLANTSHADLYLSIHHDSAQLGYLERITDEGKVAYRTKVPLSGYSIFVSTHNPRYDDSRRFADALGQQLYALGRAPSKHHGEKIPGENRELLDPKLGIYRFDDLIVLKKTTVPAVLLEVGVIVDQADEAYVSDAGHQQAIVRAIVAAVRTFRSTRPTANEPSQDVQSMPGY
ncbi:MAG: N-acetylmuramoyl-L-alanine amidase [Burkholderiales bacterium]|nr:N-acetylmuramoyl-L-alanine amidase [Burkholderiales bacterium]